MSVGSGQLGSFPSAAGWMWGWASPWRMAPPPWSGRCWSDHRRWSGRGSGRRGSSGDMLPGSTVPGEGGGYKAAWIVSWNSPLSREPESVGMVPVRVKTLFEVEKFPIRIGSRSKALDPPDHITAVLGLTLRVGPLTGLGSQLLQCAFRFVSIDIKPGTGGIQAVEGNHS